MTEQQPEEVSRVTFTFNRQISDDEVSDMQQRVDAVQAAKADPTHHHDHDTKLA